MSLMRQIGNNIFKKTSTYVLAMCAGAFFFERTFDLAADSLFETVNKGRLWKDIKGNYGGGS